MANYDRSKITPNLMALAQKFATRPGVHIYFTEPDDRRGVELQIPVLAFWGMSFALFGQVGTLDSQRTGFTIYLKAGNKQIDLYQSYGVQNMAVSHDLVHWKEAHTRFSSPEVLAGHYLWFEATLESAGDTKFYVNGALVAIIGEIGEDHMKEFQKGSIIGYRDQDHHQGSVYEIHWTGVDGKEMNIFPKIPRIYVAMADAEDLNAPKAYHVIETRDSSKVHVILVTLGGTGPHVFSDAGSAAMSGTGAITGMKTAVIEFENFEPINVSIETGMKKSSLKWGI